MARVLLSVKHRRVSLSVLALVLLTLASPIFCRSRGFSIPKDSLQKKYDLIIYAATPAGIAAALAAKESGVDSVLIIEPTSHVGGMASPGGIGLRDCVRDEIRINNSTQYQWAMRNAEFYNVSDPVWQPDNWVGELMFLEMLDDYDVELLLNTNFIEGSEGVIVSKGSDGHTRITGLHLESGEKIHCKYFIDASYEGEVMMATEVVSYTYGREHKDLYNESYAGVTESSIAQFKTLINPYFSNGHTRTLLKWVQDKPDPWDRLGQSDQNVMAYTFRACLTTNESNRVAFSPPPGYDPMDFELLRRYLIEEQAAGLSPMYSWQNLGYNGYPTKNNRSRKLDACCGSSPVGIDAAGLAADYPVANRSRRKQIYDEHKYYVQGLMWFWVNDSVLSEYTRYEINKTGLCKDEWPDNGHFPPQLYVREAVRMIGDQVYTQNDRINSSLDDGCRDNSIALGSWAFDIHEMQRVAVTDRRTKMPMVFNEGLTSYNDGNIELFEIPYYVLLPKKKEMVNLAVPNCPSVSHVAFAAIREEPILWQMGQAAGTAVGVAIMTDKDGKIPLQDVSIDQIQSSLLKQGTFIHWPPRPSCHPTPDLDN